MKLVLATKNRGKAREIGALLDGTGCEVVTLDDFPDVEMPPETGRTFEENALIKARSVAGSTGCACLADDSGLEVDSLGGAPGVRSARYAGDGATDEENWRKLLDELDGVPEQRRRARFRCVLAYVEPGGTEATFEGVLEGMIADGPRGEGGFGYDPVFYIPSEGWTAAELAAYEKNAISHRGRALERFRAWLSGRLSGRN